MKVRQIIDQAKTGELNGLAVANNDETVIGYLNMGVLELYKRFQLKVEEYIITLVDGQTIYTMPSDFMWIVAAYGEVPITSTDLVNELPINEEDNPKSINTVGWRQVQVPVAMSGSYISIMYVATAPTYTVADLAVEVDLPPQMIEPLLTYIGYRANSAITVGPQSEDSIWFQRFEASCNKVREYGMTTSDDMYMSTRLNNRGFV